MVLLRRILSLAVCFSVCLIVCVSPVYATSIEGSTGAIYPSGNVFAYSTSSVRPSYNPWFSTWPATVELDSNGLYSFLSDEVSVSIGRMYGNSYIEFIFSGFDEGTINFSGLNYISVSVINGSGNPEIENVDLGASVEVLMDNEVVYTLSDSTSSWSTGSYPVNQRFSVRLVAPSSSVNFVSSSSSSSRSLLIDISLRGTFVSNSSSGPSDPEGGTSDLTEVIEKIEVVNGTLQSINGKLEYIQDSVTEIQTAVKDTHDQLENPDSNIWQAAGSAISGAIESLFVPSEQDIANVKQGFDDLAQDKLGGAYTAMETVEDTITQVNDKLNNPSAAEGVEFPGIAVPLGGDVGTVVLAERQMVTLPMELTAILHPLGGTIISIIAGLGTFNVLKDMVECFLSGYSFAEYLHRNKGGSDD